MTGRKTAPYSLAVVLVLLFAAPIARAASSLLDYEKRVFRAAEQVERIKTDQAYEAEGLECIRELLPAREAVSLGEEGVEVDNSWLHTLLDDYELEDDPPKRLAMLSEAAGRLRSLDEHLREAGAGAGENLEASDSRERIREILSRSEYRERGEDRITAYIKSLRERALKTISDFLRNLLQIIFGSERASSMIGRFIIIGLLLAACYGVYRLARKISWGRRGSKKRIVMGEEIDASLTADGLAEAALAAARAGDFRAGVRNLYISLLYELAERGIIELEPYTTNHEYLMKVSDRAGLAAPMRYLTDRFDYFWYGMFASSEQDFAAFLERYKEAIAQARLASESAVGA